MNQGIGQGMHQESLEDSITSKSLDTKRSPIGIGGSR